MEKNKVNDGLKKLLMTKKLFLAIAISTTLLAGCAKAPVAELEVARYLVRHAADLGAEDWSPGEYQLAREALAAAERQIESQQYRSAHRTLQLAQRYAEVARIESEIAVERVAELERQRAEKARLAEEERLQILAEQQAAQQRQLELERRRQAEAEAAARAARTPQSVPAPPAPVPVVLLERYEVKPGQSLADIAALSEVYDDRLLWPLIYRANRDQIKTPREISPGQILDIPRDKNREELEAARQEALQLDLF